MLEAHVASAGAVLSRWTSGWHPALLPLLSCCLQMQTRVRGRAARIASCVWRHEKAGSRSVSSSTCAWFPSSLCLLIHEMGIKGSALLTQPCRLFWDTPPYCVSVSRSPAGKADVRRWFSPFLIFPLIFLTFSSASFFPSVAEWLPLNPLSLASAVLSL